jgi:uncharacterized damage-inducible protein DinB
MIGRPERTEAAEFYWTYIDKVAGDDVIAVLEGQMEEVMILHAAVTEEQSLYRYASGKWSVRQSMNHVTDTERIFGSRALWFARGLEGALPSFDQNVAVAGAGADAVAWAAQVDEFMQVRMATLSFFKNLPEEAWMRRGVASGKEATVRAMAFIMAGHAAHHFALLRERYLQG